MARTREEFHNYLKEKTGAENIYFQPPNNLKIKYPAIIYERNSINNEYADNLVYLQSMEYLLTIIDSNPDSELVNVVSKMPNTRFNRHYISDNFNHDVFTMIF